MTLESYSYLGMSTVVKRLQDQSGIKLTYVAQGSGDHADDGGDGVYTGGASLAYDANGNVTTDDHGYTLIYDGWNRLVQVKNGSTILKTYAYDGLGRRISETAGSNVTHLYYTSSWQLIEERLGGSGVATRQYV